jgi:hypothetical protein
MTLADESSRRRNLTFKPRQLPDNIMTQLELLAPLFRAPVEALPRQAILLILNLKIKRI